MYAAQGSNLGVAQGSNPRLAAQGYNLGIVAQSSNLGLAGEGSAGSAATHAREPLRAQMSSSWPTGCYGS